MVPQSARTPAAGLARRLRRLSNFSASTSLPLILRRQHPSPGRRSDDCQQDRRLHVVSDVTIKDAVSGPIIVHPGGALVLMGSSEAGLVVLGGGYARVRES